MIWKPTNRWQAFGIHLGFSLLVLVLLATVIYNYWYPGFLFRYDGGIDGMEILTCVDIVIGPLLTLCVYKVGKKSLVFDLTCIVILQISCLSYGMWAVNTSRPVAIVFASGSYATTSRHGYEAEKQVIDHIQILQQYPWPVSLAVDLPDDSENAINDIWKAMGSAIQYNADNYVLYEKKLSSLARYAHTADDIKGSPQAMRDYQAQHPDLRFFPMTTSLYDGYVAVDMTSGKIMEFFASGE